MYLNCKTYFSFRYGTIATKELVEMAVEKDVSMLALTNINTTCDLWEFVAHCRKAGVKPVCGVEIRNEGRFCYLLLARNNDGLQSINAFLSKHLLEKKPFPMKPPADENVYVVHPFGYQERNLTDNEYIGVLPWELNKLYGKDLRRYQHKYVVQQPVTFKDKRGYLAHKIVRAIDLKKLVSRLEQGDLACKEETMVPEAALVDVFKQRYEFMINNTYKLLNDCSIQMDFDAPKDKEHFTDSAGDDRALLEKLALEGLERRNLEGPKALERVRSELSVINDMRCNAYFLMTEDMIRYARMNRFYHIGRGSGANSLVAYCLGITDVDPLEQNLPFERFLNRERSSPPDFDLDFSWRDRDKVIDYLFRKYGSEKTAMVAMYKTFQEDSTIDEVGKVFGLPPDEIKMLKRKKRATDQTQGWVLEYARFIEQFPNHLSVHAGGVVVSQQPILQYTSLFMPNKGFATAQLDMLAMDRIRLNKFDVLSQRGLGVLKECQEWVWKNKREHVDIGQLDLIKLHAATLHNLSIANTIGCFYSESPAMRSLLLKLKCSDFFTLVVATSILRPGVKGSGMQDDYLDRYHGKAQVEYLHPCFEELLSETFGLMIFQEDVIRIGHAYAGLTMAEADTLRRAMTGKYDNNASFELVRERFFAGAALLKRDPKTTAYIWKKMEAFVGYSFNRAHAASYCIESIQSLYLKTKYPMEFMVAVINNGGGFYETEYYFIELRKTGAHLHLPCVNESLHDTSIDGINVYAGLGLIKGLKEELIKTIVLERRKRGPYEDLDDLVRRTGVEEPSLHLLITAGALRFTRQSKQVLRWQAHTARPKSKQQLFGAPLLFCEAPKDYELPTLVCDPLDDVYDEMETLGFPFRDPFELLEDDARSYVLVKDLPDLIGQPVTMLVYFVERREITTKQQRLMAVGTYLDANLDWISTVHFPDAYEQHATNETGFYRISGIVQETYGVPDIKVNTMEPMPIKTKQYANL